MPTSPNNNNDALHIAAIRRFLDSRTYIEWTAEKKLSVVLLLLNNVMRAREFLAFVEGGGGGDVERQEEWCEALIEEEVDVL